MQSGAAILDVVRTRADLVASLGVVVPEADREEDVPPKAGLGRIRRGSGGWTKQGIRG